MNDFDALAQFTVDTRAVTTVACDECGSVVCYIDPGSGLSGIADDASRHWRENHGTGT